MEREEQFINSLKYSDVAVAISRDYSLMFCVNTDTDAFVEFVPDEHSEKLNILTVGKNFGDTVRSFRDSTYPPDLDIFHTAVTKQNVLDVLKADDSFTLDFRMVMDKKPIYVNLKATRLHTEDPSHILLALCSSDAHMRRMVKYKESMRNQLTFAAISEALTADYDCLFYVDTETNEFVEYSSSDVYKSLGIAPFGSDFFEMCRNEFCRVIYEEDRDVFLRSFDKSNLLKILSGDRWSLLSFRVVVDNAPINILVKITQLSHIDDHHLAIGLSNIESNLPHIQAYEQIRKIANRDSLTGVKSKHAFSMEEERINREIKRGECAPFSVVVCDVNGLKKINDTQGHQAGDDYLRRSCKMICNIFAHSPVYRIGGDEFVAILTGSDYENRGNLIRKLHTLSASHIGTNEAVVSGGLSDYNAVSDHYIQDIFERADATMYKEKMDLKSLGASIRDIEAVDRDTEAIPILNMRKHLLIADDQQTNREILGALLEEDYDILYASDGIETMKMLRRHKDEVALLLLDLYMPNMSGREVLREMQVDEDLMSIPVIMMTIDPDAELDSLRLGAMDFISKPYPDIAIVKVRIAKCIELSENRDLIRNTQRDKLTGLLNYDYFVQYVGRLDHQNTGKAFDVFACDIKQFRSINKQYGRQFGDLVLRSIGNNFRKLARKTGGIGCRQGADTFLLYCPHRDNYEQLIENFKTDLFVEKETSTKISLRFGVFENADGEPDIEKRFSCAKAAADSVANSPEIICGYYHNQPEL